MQSAHALLGIVAFLLLGETSALAQVPNSPTPLPGFPHGGCPPFRYEKKNLGLAAGSGIFDGDLLAITVSEENQGNMDLNGDGDAVDYVLHLHDLATGSTRSLGIASYPVDLRDGILLHSASGVLEYYNLSTDTNVSTGLRVGTYPTENVKRLDSWVAFLVAELSQGADLNGDGDPNDGVLHLLDLNTGAVTNLGVAISYTPGFALGPTMLFYQRSERADGSADFNGDGDALDWGVAHVYDFASGTTRNLGLVAIEAALDGDLASFYGYEQDQGAMDFDGDGDAFDYAVFGYDHVSGATTNLHSAYPWYGPFGVHRDWLFWNAKEEDIDLNGDGDRFDYVVQVYDRRTGVTTNLGLAGGTGFDVRDGVLAFDVSEGSQNRRDRNGDGDWIDYVVLVYDLESGTRINTRLAVDDAGSLRLLEGAVAIGVSEWGQDTDLNGDGDTFDEVLSVFDLSTQQSQDLGLSLYLVPGWEGEPLYPLLFPGADVLGFVAQEVGEDLNGDGDAGDLVVFAHSVSQNSRARIGTLASVEEDGVVYGGFIVSDASTFLFVASEPPDLNGDGDAIDYVFQAARPRSACRR